MLTVFLDKQGKIYRELAIPLDKHQWDFMEAPPFHPLHTIGEGMDLPVFSKTRRFEKVPVQFFKEI